MKILLTLVFAAAASLFASDASGVWTGSFRPDTDPNSEKRPAHLILKQEGSKLTGSGGPDAAEQEPIMNGKAEDGVITFEIAHGEHIMRFQLKQSSDEMRGVITREGNGRKDIAQMELKREK